MTRSVVHLALVLGVSPLAAQDLPAGNLPACDQAAPQSFPCRSNYDKPPVLLDAPRPAGNGPRKTPRVWVYISDSGNVQATQIARPAGYDFDVAAIAVAKRLHFTPATLGDRTVAVWLVVPIETQAAPQPCSEMAVPLSAGWAHFADSTRLQRPELGTMYSYGGVERIDGLQLYVFVYPQTGWPSIEEQGRAFPLSLDSMRQRGDFAAYDVLGSDGANVKVRSARLRREITIRGRVVRVKLRMSSGKELESYYAVFAEEQKYVRFRVSYPSGQHVQSVVDDFVKQVLEARAAEPAHCPAL